MMVGECSGPAEVALMARLIDGVLRSGRSVLYLSTGRAEARGLEAAVRSRGGPARLTIRDVGALSSLAFWARPRAHSELTEDRETLAPVLRAAAAGLGRDAIPWMRPVALARRIWSALRSQIECRAVVARTNYQPLSAVILADEQATDRLTVCFQHSVVTCPGSFVPISSRRFAAFGATSRALLESLDTRFGAGTLCRDVVEAGSLVDDIVARSPGGSAGPILAIDPGEGFAPRFFGVAGEYVALRAAVSTLAARWPVVVRTHPRGGRARWDGPVSISRGRSLGEDLAAASAVIGLFSTVLPVAAASGVPTFILWKPGWFYTPDLAPFVADQFVTPDSLPDRVEAVLTDDAVRARARQSGLEAAARYFAGSRRCEFDPDMIEALLAPP